MRLRRLLKHGLALAGELDRGRPVGATLLTWHRVGGDSGDELDVPRRAFERQLDHVSSSGIDVVALDVALDRLAAGDATPSLVLTFDDGFADVHDVAWPMLRERRLPFTLYLAAGLVGGTMRWEGSTAGSQGADALQWDDVAEMADSGLFTVGNHTWSHARPDEITADELDRCSEEIVRRLGDQHLPRHFAWTWGVESERRRPLVAKRFRSAATGEVGRNPIGSDPLRLRRVPVRASDPPAFFAAKLRGRLFAERSYARAVAAAKTTARRRSARAA